MPAITGTGWSRRWRPIAGWSRPDARRTTGRPQGAGRDDDLRRPDDEPASRRRRRRRRSRSTSTLGLDAGRPAALDEHLRDPRPVDDPGAAGRGAAARWTRIAGLLRPARAAERTAAAVAAVHARCGGSGPPPSRARPRRGGSRRPSAGSPSTGATPSSRSIAATSSSNAAPSSPSMPVVARPLGADVLAARRCSSSSSRASRRRRPRPASIVIAPSHVVSRPWLR